MSLHSWRIICALAVLLVQLGIEAGKAPKATVPHVQHVLLLVLLAFQTLVVVASRSMSQMSRWITLFILTIEILCCLYSTWQSVSESPASGTPASLLNLSIQNSRDIQILAALLAVGLASFRSKKERT
jgi:hypothetical protein